MSKVINERTTSTKRGHVRRERPFDGAIDPKATVGVGEKTFDDIRFRVYRSESATTDSWAATEPLPAAATAIAV